MKAGPWRRFQSSTQSSRPMLRVVHGVHCQGLAVLAVVLTPVDAKATATVTTSRPLLHTIMQEITAPDTLLSSRLLL